ncbi:polysaccharide deacetylase family protein [Salipiger mucosus]|uniref:Chitooligosaccharide deacetylase n=1 Tax=Salipiger mucosus DSM 16094 TaxID=1123237 RepID=S9QFY9_9RHOB|nr:polysaccharide deacetylase [Salipiger mucosus]EPX80351.1 polysaccharide deacetylase [Salipiger mucosus DSM 16094]
MLWPNGARCAVMLTFDFDAETLWLSRDPANARKPGVLSQGIYGARRGVPEILKVLKSHGLPATFYVPGWTAETYPDRIHAILEAGHEIGHHGYLHEWIDPSQPEAEREAFEKGLEALDRVAGIVPTGYRSPAGETSPNLITMIERYGLLYDSSLMTDIEPYRHVLEDGAPGPVELPWHWSSDDAPHMMFAIQSPRAIRNNDEVFTLWRDEFDAIREMGGLFNLVMHPQFIGRPARLALLHRMIEHIEASGDAWIATGDQVARHWAAQDVAGR